MDDYYPDTGYHHRQETTELTTYSKDWLSAQMTSPLAPEVISRHLLMLSTAFPTVVRNYDEYEFKAMQDLWHLIFQNVPEDVMQEAIKRFIINDRKGFFPSPGQIVGCIEQIVTEQKAEADRIANEESRARMRARNKRIRNGENCATCRFCRHEWHEPKMYDKDYQAWNWAETDEEKAKYLNEVLYCQNQNSGSYEWYTYKSDIAPEDYDPKLDPIWDDPNKTPMQHSTHSDSVCDFWERRQELLAITDGGATV